jgi:hypothetical protein
VSPWGQCRCRSKQVSTQFSDLHTRSSNPTRGTVCAGQSAFGRRRTMTARALKPNGGRERAGQNHREAAPRVGLVLPRGSARVLLRARSCPRRGHKARRGQPPGTGPCRERPPQEGLRAIEPRRSPAVGAESRAGPASVCSFGRFRLGLYQLLDLRVLVAWCPPGSRLGARPESTTLDHSQPFSRRCSWCPRPHGVRR